MFVRYFHATLEMYFEKNFDHFLFETFKHELLKQQTTVSMT